MGNVVAIVAVALALIAAGSIAYIAWELTSEDSHPTDEDDNQPSKEE